MCNGDDGAGDRPISNIAVDYVTDKVIEAVESAVRTHVIDRWSRHRAYQFFDSFCKALQDKGIAEAELSKMLDELLSDDRRSEVGLRCLSIGLPHQVQNSRATHHRLADRGTRCDKCRCRCQRGINLLSR